MTDRFLSFDLPVMIAASLPLTAMLLRPVLDRATGMALLLAYAAYVWVAQG